MKETEKSPARKFLAVLEKIALALLALCVLSFVVSSVLARTLTDPWEQFYCKWANLISTIGIAVFAVMAIACNFRNFLRTVLEALRKFVVTLKRNPSLIPLAMMLISFLLFSLNLTDLSNSTAKIQGAGMGLSQFCIMLFSLLSMVCMLNAFPRRKKPNIPMIVLMFVMLGIMIYSDIHYMNAIRVAISRPESPIIIDVNTAYIAEAYNMLMTHIVLLGITAALVVLLPVYSKLLRMIKTSVEVEGNDDMATIEITE